MTVHELKIWPDGYKAVLNGTKTAEWRLNDRNFQVGDILYLRAWVPQTRQYMLEASTIVEVTHIVKGSVFGIPKEYCMMSIRRLTQS
jgi:hypothetical protein